MDETQFLKAISNTCLAAKSPALSLTLYDRYYHPACLTQGTEFHAHLQHVFLRLFRIFTQLYQLSRECMWTVLCVNCPATYVHAGWPASLCFSPAGPVKCFAKGLNLPRLFLGRGADRVFLCYTASVFIRHLLLSAVWLTS